MKKLLLLAIPLCLILVTLQNGYASSSYLSYEVVEIRSDGLVVKNSDGNLSLIKKDPGDIKVGDIVRYDSIRDRLRKSPWQLAKIIKMTDRTLTLQTGGDETVEMNMRSKYRNEFKEGDHVKYNAAKGQIMKSDLQPMDDEQ
jgi:ASC-1-like (ASCH) protein